jgi:hypothetical protein
VKIAVVPDVLYRIRGTAPNLSGMAVSGDRIMTDDARLIGRDVREGSIAAIISVPSAIAWS